MFKVITIQKILVLLLGLAAFVSAELKIGYINSEKILMEYQGTKEAEEKLKKEVAKVEQEATERKKKMEEMREQLDKQSLLLSAERKKELEDNLQKEWIDYQKFLQENAGPEGSVAKKNQELFQPIIEQVNKILEVVAKNENYDFIFDARGGTLVWAKSAYDLTEKVIQALKSGK
jgi:outer membrane protein